MNKIPTFLLLLLLVTAITIPPTEAFAKRGSDDSHHEQEDRNDDRGHHNQDADSDDDWDDDEDSDDDDNSSDSSTPRILEIEADVFTDTTIVKVERFGSKKVVFQTDADTENEVVDAVVAKLNLNRADVEAALDFEIEDRASRTKERAKITGQSNSTVSDDNLRTQIVKLQQLIELLLARLAQQTPTN